MAFNSVKTRNAAHSTSGIVKVEMSERALRLIFEWLDLHRAELKQAWEKAKNGIVPDKIEPLR